MMTRIERATTTRALSLPRRLTITAVAFAEEGVGACRLLGRLSERAFRIGVGCPCRSWRRGSPARIEWCAGTVWRLFRKWSAGNCVAGSRLMGSCR